MLRPLNQGTNILFLQKKKKKSFSSGSQISTMQTLPFFSTEEWDRELERQKQEKPWVEIKIVRLFTRYNKSWECEQS